MKGNNCKRINARVIWLLHSVVHLVLIDIKKSVNARVMVLALFMSSNVD